MAEFSLLEMEQTLNCSSRDTVSVRSILWSVRTVTCSKDSEDTNARHSRGRQGKEQNTEVKYRNKIKYKSKKQRKLRQEHWR